MLRRRYDDAQALIEDHQREARLRLEEARASLQAAYHRAQLAGFSGPTWAEMRVARTDQSNPE